MTEDPRIGALPDSHGHAKGEHKAFAEERPIPYTARMLFLWFFHACRRGAPRFMMVADHINYLTFEDPAAVHVVRRALKLAQAGDLYGAAETAGVELGHASVVSEGLRKGMRYSIGAELDNDPRSRPDAQNIVDAMKPDGLIRSVHFLPITHPQHGENWMWAFDNPELKEFYELVGTERVWELYMETLLDAIEKLPGHIVGHFSIEVGSDVQTGPYVYITDQNHGYENPDEVVHVQWPHDVPVIIGDGSWLGTGVVVLPGTELGRNVVVAAGAVVRGVFPDHCVIAGVPARIVRRYVPGSGWVTGSAASED